MKDIILVGNGPSVMDQKIGHLVDEFKTVVRFNDFVITGYEQFVGTRTDVWVRNFESKDGQFIGDTIFLYPKRISSHPQVKHFMNTREFTHVIDEDFYQKVDDEVGFDHGWSSSGLVMIRHFMSTGRSVTIHGFDHFSRGLHYYENRRGGFKFHNSEKERSYVRSLVASGSVNLIRSFS